MPREKKAASAKEPGRLSQVKTLYQGAVKQDPKIPLYLIGAFVVGFCLIYLLNFIWWHPIYFGVLGVLTGAVLALLLFGRLAEKAAYGALDGQPGAAGAALGALKRGWYVEQEPVAAEAGRARNVRDMSQAAMVFRAVGKPGVVLVSEGPRSNATKLLESERKRVARVCGPEVPVTTYRIGKDDGAVKVSDLTKTINKLDKKLTAAEITAVTKRLRALGAARPPIPQGMDPRGGQRGKIDRRAMRGR